MDDICVQIAIISNFPLLIKRVNLSIPKSIVTTERIWDFDFRNIKCGRKEIGSK